MKIFRPPPVAGPRAPRDRLKFHESHRKLLLLFESRRPTGMTDRELAGLFGGNPETVRKRRGELKTMGLVEKGGVRGFNGKNKTPSHVWVITQAGLDTLNPKGIDP